MLTRRKAVSDVKLNEDLSHIDQIPKGDTYFEYWGNLVMGTTTDGMDFMLGPGAYRLGGGRKGYYRVDDSLMCQSLLQLAPQDQRGKMHDNGQISNRLDPVEWAGEAQIKKKGDSVILQPVGGYEFICQPPYWQIKGEHFGVKLDVTLGGKGPANRHFGPWEKAAENGAAGYDQACWAEGTFVTDGKTYTIDKGYGVHLHVIQRNIDLVELFQQFEYYWIWIVNDSIEMAVMKQLGVQYGAATIDNHEYAFVPGNAAITELEYWIDPQNHSQVPIRWHVSMASPEGMADMTIAAGSRLSFGYAMRTGQTRQYGFLCSANGRFCLRDGRCVSIENVMTYVEYGSIHMRAEAGSPLAG